MRGSSWTTAVTFSFFERLIPFLYKIQSKHIIIENINIIWVHGRMLPRGVSIVTEELHTGARKNLALYNRGGLY